MDALRRAAAIEPGREVLDAIGGQAGAVEPARLEAMASTASIPDPGIRAIAAMRSLEGKSRETIAKRMDCGRTSPAKQLRRFLRGTIQPPSK